MHILQEIGAGLKTSLCVRAHPRYIHTVYHVHNSYGTQRKYVIHMFIRVCLSTNKVFQFI